MKQVATCRIAMCAPIGNDVAACSVGFVMRRF